MFLTSHGLKPTPELVTAIINYFIDNIISPIANKRLEQDEITHLVNCLNDDVNVDDILQKYFTSSWVDKSHHGNDNTWYHHSNGKGYGYGHTKSYVYSQTKSYGYSQTKGHGKGQGKNNNFDSQSWQKSSTSQASSSNSLNSQDWPVLTSGNNHDKTKS
jgi:hypothetical protein